MIIACRCRCLLYGVCCLLFDGLLVVACLLALDVHCL